MVPVLLVLACTAHVAAAFLSPTPSPPGLLARRGQAVAPAGRRSVFATRTRMALATPKEESPAMAVLRDGIKAVGVGVKGSKPIPDDLIAPLSEVITALAKGEPSPEWATEQERIKQRACSFLGTLFVKVDLLPSDAQLLAKIADLHPEKAGVGRVREGCSSAQILAAAVGDEGSEELRALSLKLLDGECLSEEEAFRLGTCFFDSEELVALKVLCIHLLRVRYETMDEWYGLVRAQQATLATGIFPPPTRKREIGASKIIQLADPFDGTNKADSFTPLLAKHLQEKWGGVAVGQSGETSGPKYGPNLYQIAHALGEGAAWLKGGLDEGAQPPQFGWYVDQKDASKGLTEWVGIRRNVIKRPCLATSEKFVDTHGADVIVASAFHPSFGEKMFDIAESASDFSACIIVRKGTEGTLCLSLSRPAEFLVGVRRTDGKMDKYQFEFGAKDAGVTSVPEKEQQYALTTDIIAERIKSYAATGTSGDKIFDDRVKVTCQAYDVAMAFVREGKKLHASAGDEVTRLVRDGARSGLF